MAEPLPSTLVGEHAWLDPIAPALWSALAPPDRVAAYDRLARGYDLVVGNGLYNRLVWGCRTAEYATAARRLLAGVGDDHVLDFGCGSLVFTARAYAGYEDRLVLFDRSLKMLRRAQGRLPAGRFVQGDAFAPPFAPRAFDAAMAWGMIHLFGSASPFLEMLAACVRPGAEVATSSLVLAGRSIGDRMLRALHRRGEASEPEARATVEAAFARHFILERSDLSGSMLFLAGRAPPLSTIPA